MGENIFTKFQWQQVVSDLITEDSLSGDEWIEMLDYLWDYLPPKLHSKAIKILEEQYKPYNP